jgi:hypothetical protein
MDYMECSGIIPDNDTVMFRQYNLLKFFGKLKKIAIDYCRFDMDRTMPVKVECPDESQGLKSLYFVSTFGSYPFVGGKLGAELDIEAIAPASHHAENLVYVMGSHTGYDHQTKTWGTIYREKEGAFSSCCGKLAAVMEPYMQEYEYARASIRIYKKNGKFFLQIPHRFLGTDDSDECLSVRLCLNSCLIKGDAQREGRITPESPQSLVFEVHPDLARTLETGNKNITDEPMPIGDILGGDYFRFSGVPCDSFSDGITRRLHPLMHKIVSSEDYHPMVTIANVQTWLEFNRFVDAIHDIQDVESKGIFGVSGLTVDLYFDERTYSYSNVYYPQYAFFKTGGQRDGLVIGLSELNNFFDAYKVTEDVFLLDQILECNDGIEGEINF